MDLLYKPDWKKLKRDLAVKGLFIATRCDSEEEARTLLMNVEK